MVMRLAALFGIVRLLMAPTAMAQDGPASAPEVRPGGGVTWPDFGVSLDRIREGIANAPAKRILGDRQVTFRVEVRERATFEAMFKNIDFKPGPVPAGGLYAYEQQRRLFNPVSRPLMQPYAAYSPGQFMVVALENLLGHFLVKPALEALKDENRKRALRNAQREVNLEIEAYCAQQPNRYEVLLCNPNR
jgi:hypothetical protein